MSLFIFNFPSDFQQTLAAIDALDPNTDIPGILPIIDYLNGGQIVGQQSTFSDFGGVTGQTLYVLEDYGQQTTVFTIYDANQQLVSQFSMASLLDYAGGWELEAAVSSLGGAPDYISYDVGNRIEGYSATDEMIGEGRFYGRGKGDKIELEDLVDELGTTSRSFAFGGGGHDILKAALLKTTLNGGSGNDTLVLEFGASSMKGGNGADDFIFDNGFWDASGTAAQGAQNARGTVKDFLSGTDSLVFASVDDTMVFGDTPVRTSLADLFGAGDLSTLANFTEDGLTFRFRENAAGNAVITRSGTDGSGNTYDERVVLQGVGLADIDRSEVFLQDYAADTYEFF